VNIPDGALIDLRRRIADTRWPEKESRGPIAGRAASKAAGTRALLGNGLRVAIPVAVSVFPGEQYQAPRSWTERAYPKLIYYHRAEKGGHFAVWEQPGFSLRKSERRSPRYADESMTHLEGSGV